MSNQDLKPFDEELEGVSPFNLSDLKEWAEQELNSTPQLQHGPGWVTIQFVENPKPSPTSEAQSVVDGTNASVPFGGGSETLPGRMSAKQKIEAVYDNAIDLSNPIEQPQDLPFTQWYYEVRQRAPYTYVELTKVEAHFSEVEQWNGFAKANPRFDEFCPTRGREIALRRAIKLAVSEGA